MADEWKIGIRLKGCTSHASESKMIAREENEDKCGGIKQQCEDCNNGRRIFTPEYRDFCTSFEGNKD